VSTENETSSSNDNDFNNDNDNDNDNDGYCNNIHERKKDTVLENVMPNALPWTPTANDDGSNNASSSSSSSNSNIIEPTSRLYPSVRFSTAEFRYYPITIGDNPSVSSGIPLTIGWDHWEEATRVVPVNISGDSDNYNYNYNDEDRNDNNTKGAASAIGSGSIITDPDCRCHNDNNKNRFERRQHGCTPPAAKPQVRVLEPAVRAYILKTSGHSKRELIAALRRTTSRRNELRQTATEQQLLPMPFVVALDWIQELWESRPRGSNCTTTSGSSCTSCFPRDCGRHSWGASTKSTNNNNDDDENCNGNGGTDTEGRVKTMMLL